MLKLSEKKLNRAKKFRKIGVAISSFTKIGNPDVPDYHTGLPSNFRTHNGSSDQINEIHGIGPVFKTPQWERAVKSVK